MSNTSKRNRSRIWTKEDDEYLLSNYPRGEWSEMVNYLGRSEKALRDRASILKVTRDKRSKTHDEFVQEFYGIFSEKEYLLMSKYKRYNEHIEYFHKPCGRYGKSTPASLLSGHGCICNKHNSNKVHEKDFLMRVRHWGEDLYETTDRLPFVDMSTPIEMLHKECETVYETTPSNFHKGRRCPFCSSKGNSKGERLVEKSLQYMGIDYIEQATFDGMVNINQFYYDFLLDDLDVIVEYQGKQHYTPVEYLGGFNKFKSQIKRDNIKLKFAIANGYTLIEVPYTMDTYTKVLNFLQQELPA